MKKKSVFLIDVFPVIYRAHFAMVNQRLGTTSGINTAAVLGFCNYLFQLLFKETPTHIAAIFDSYSRQRSGTHSEYKANREKAPEDVMNAVPLVESIIDALNITKIKLEGFEADDVIGTLASALKNENVNIYIVSPDKDFAQLVCDNIFLYRPSYQGVNFEILDAEGVVRKFGVPPEQIPDLLALKGDPIDNIPGVPKIGDKTALQLLNDYTSVEEVLDNIDAISKKAIKKTLEENAEQALMSKMLALINTEIPIDFHLTDIELKSPDVKKLNEILDQLEFRKLKERIYANSFFKKLIKDNQETIKPEDIHCELIPVTEVIFPDIIERIKSERKFVFLNQNGEDGKNIFFSIQGVVYKYILNAPAESRLLFSVFENEHIRKISYDIKPLIRYLISEGVEIKGKIFDVQIAHYVVNPESNHQLDRIIAELNDEPVISEETSEEIKFCYLASRLEGIKNKLEEAIISSGQQKVFFEIETPLIPVLALMESNGIRIDRSGLKEISEKFSKELEFIEDRIYALAGEKINLRSPMQISDLFSRIIEKKNFKRTKSGQISTSEAILQELAGEYEIAAEILRHRKLSKLISTYTDSLPGFINKETGRVHADFIQASTATGRLSCRNPNLQNLPILSEEGREVRKGIVASPGHLILAADYSQIELRILASVSQDNVLMEAFRKGEDVHTVTAARVYNVPASKVTDEMRSKAKMVNYGIAYGISPYGLSQNLKISSQEAKEIIEKYFQEFVGIKNFIEENLKFVQENEFSRTLTGRRRYINDINSRNGTVRKMAERIAINAPIQGLAADIIKIAMIKIAKRFKVDKIQSKMILQVHDELVFEVLANELSIVKEVVRNEMIHAVDLLVPMEVNIGVGKNWLEQDTELVFQ